MGPVPCGDARAYITGPGSVAAIRYGLLPVPCPGPADILVRVGAVAANPVDVLVRPGSCRTPMPSPFVIGRDFVGVVAETRPGAAGFTPGPLVGFGVVVCLW